MQYDWREIDPLLDDGLKPSQIAELPPAKAQGITAGQISRRSRFRSESAKVGSKSAEAAAIRAKYIPAADLGAREREYHDRRIQVFDRAIELMQGLASDGIRYAKKLQRAGEIEKASQASRRAVQSIKDLASVVAMERDMLGLPAPRTPEMAAPFKELVVLWGTDADRRADGDPGDDPPTGPDAKTA